MHFVEKACVMEPVRIQRAIARMAAEIVEYNRGLDGLVLVGIKRRGLPIAERLAAAMERLEGKKPPVIPLDISFYRDDLTLIAPSPVVNESPLAADLVGATVVLVDDVLYTGKTIHAAVGHLIRLGEPRRIEVATLVDRGHRVIPYGARFVGLTLPTRAAEIVKVMIEEIDDAEKVLIVEIPPT